MKKILALVLALSMVLCSVAALAEGYGLGVQTSIGSSKPASAEKDGTAQVDSTICALVVDDEGKIVSCLFDVAQTKVAFNAAGEITADMTAVIKSKQEKGDEYNMRPASPIGKEWYEQMTALESWCIGKTVEEVLATPLDESGKATDADLVSGCTVHINAQLKALEKAAANAK